MRGSANFGSLTNDSLNTTDAAPRHRLRTNAFMRGGPYGRPEHVPRPGTKWLLLCVTAFVVMVMALRKRTIFVRSGPDTLHTPAPHRAASTVAVCFSGWLGVNIPGTGASARRHMIDPLAADVFVAGTYLLNDCSPHAAGACLRARLQGLEPITQLSLRPMLTMAQLRGRAHAAPAFAKIAARFNASETYQGVNMFSPVLGNPRGARWSRTLAHPCYWLS